MELFNKIGCLTDEGLHALIDGSLDELQRLEAAEHLAYCDKCLDRYTEMLSDTALEAPPESVTLPVMRSIWARVMQNTVGRCAVAGVAAALALTMWGSGMLNAGSWKNRVPTQNETVKQPGIVSELIGACSDFFDEGLNRRLTLPFFGKSSWENAPANTTTTTEQNTASKAAE